MILGRLETRNYEWTTLTETPEEAIENLRQAWEFHASDMAVNYYSWAELEDSVTLTPLTVGETNTNCNVCEYRKTR